MHVGVDDPDKAIHVANGMRVHVPILFALAANSPYWRADDTGFASTRMPIFRAFPRVGIPPYYEDWADWERRIGFMVDSGVIDDYTFLWYDVRPHPNFGTVEIRAMDAQTRVEHTLALAALIQAMVKELSDHYEAGKQLARYPYEMLDENKWLAARHGMEGELVDLPERRLVPAKELAKRLYDRLKEHAQDLGSAAELEAIKDILHHGNGAQRQRVVYEANHDYGEVMREIVEATSARVESVGWPAARTCSSSARSAARRCPRTSPSARTAARGCASARRSSSAAASRRSPRPRGGAARRSAG